MTSSNCSWLGSEERHTTQLVEGLPSRGELVKVEPRKEVSDILFPTMKKRIHCDLSLFLSS